jgi:hypothetical protein
VRGVDPKWKMPQQNHEDVPNRWEYPTDQEVWGSRHGPHTAHFAYKNMQKTENLGNTLWLFNIKKMVYLLKLVIFHGYVK